MQHRIDFKSSFEDTTKLKVYPVLIPQDAKYPAIQLNITGGARNTDSNQNDSNIEDYRISLTVCCNHLSDCYKYEQMLKTKYNHKPFKHGETKSLIMYYSSSVELYNHALGLYELSIDFTTKKLK